LLSRWRVEARRTIVGVLDGRRVVVVGASAGIGRAFAVHAAAEGARLVAGGTRDGAFFEPTVLTGVTPAMDAYREEFFGPVAVVYQVADEDAAVDLANDTGFGLGSYVFTTDELQAQRVADRIEAGMVYVNIVLADSAELPFGGIKRSGTGRELGYLAADEFVNKKLVRVG